MKLSYNLEQRLRKFCVPRLMNYIVAISAVVYVVSLAAPQFVYGQLPLIRSRVLAGEVWRLVTFLFMPPSPSLLWAVVALYCYWMVGTQLEGRWGRVKFNLFYAIGALGAILASLATGYADSHFLNLSLCFAFAILYPDVQFMVFFVVPVKARYLALLAAVYFLFSFIFGNWSTRVTILLSFANVFLFMGSDLIQWFRHEKQYWKTRYHFRRHMR